MLYPNPIDEFLLTPEKKKLITEKYNVPYRKYHNIEHISKMWHYYWQERGEPSWREKIKIATIFHDVIIFPGSEFNELDSANYMLKALNVKLDPNNFYHDIYYAILATADHTNPFHDNMPDWVQMFLDLDLYEIGSTENIYKENGIKIYNESKIFLDDETILNGRKKWLEKMLSSKRIFRYFTEREQQARINLEHDLESIQ